LAVDPRESSQVIRVVIFGFRCEFARCFDARQVAWSAILPRIGRSCTPVPLTIEADHTSLLPLYRGNVPRQLLNRLDVAVVRVQVFLLPLEDLSCKTYGLGPAPGYSSFLELYGSSVDHALLFLRRQPLNSRVPDLLY
jgi:hypothetical protein